MKYKFPLLNIMKNLMLSVLIFGLFLIVGCDNSFTPLKENENLVFSMFGVLDINADTQWVRVMPIGTSLLPADAAPNGSEVRLIRESTGDITVLNDSLFRFNEDAYVWNYWTNEPIQSNERYSIIAESPDGRQSSVSIETPSPPVVPEVEYNEEFERIFIDGIVTDSLVVLESRYLVQPITEDMGCADETEIVISHMDQLVIRPDDQYYMTIEDALAISRELGVNSYIVNRRAVVIITATSSWPNTSILTENEAALPDVISNVENGTGVVAGIARQEIVITPRIPACIPS